MLIEKKLLNVINTLDIKKEMRSKKSKGKKSKTYFWLYL